MHSNKVRHQVKKGLENQVERDIIDHLPSFHVTKLYNGEHRREPKELFKVELKRQMFDTAAYDVDTVLLHDHLTEQFNADFQIIQPW